ncbi:MAG: arylsulfatase, partial [Bacteroidales bacterium]|nr:arylsulfatase [Bacteroidales bacterium]
MKTCYLYGLILGFTIVGGSIYSCHGNTLTRKQPNIVLIVVDDLGYADMSCTGLADDVKTPNIDQ